LIKFPAVNRKHFIAGSNFVSAKRSSLELHAPITAEIELQLEELVAKFGEKKVAEALAALVTKCSKRMEILELQSVLYPQLIYGYILQRLSTFSAVGAVSASLLYPLQPFFELLTFRPIL
jgi:hypothetical protein